VETVQRREEGFMNMVELKLAFSYPDVVFGHPRRVVTTTALSGDDKIALLRKWKHTLERSWDTDAAGAARDAAGSEVSARLAAIQRALDDLSRRQ
jgi:hypothetical protein